MQYENVVQGRFLSRPNRFIAVVDIGGTETVCHVKNTGRCRELLVPGAALRQAAAAGVNVVAYACRVAPDRMEIDRPVPVIL